MPVVRVIKAAWTSVLFHQRFNDLFRAARDRKHSYYTVALQDAEHDHFASGSPASFTRAIAAKHRLIALNRTLERVGALFSPAHHLANQVKESLSGRARCRAMKAKTISRHAEHKVVEQFALGAFTQPCALPDTAMSVRRATPSTLEPTISKQPRPMVSTSWTDSSHGARILTKSGTV